MAWARVVVNGAQNWHETMKLAGLDWRVGKHPLYDAAGHELPAWGIFKENVLGLADVFISTVGSRYIPIQNEYCFQFVDALMESQGCHYESAGALGNGEKIWCLAKIPMDFEINGGDSHQTYLLFTSSHDGSLAAQCKLTTVRVVCQNTLNQAVSLNGTYVKVKHTRDAERKLEAAQKLISNAKQTTESLKGKLLSFSERIITKEHYLDVLDRLFPAPKDPKANDTKRNNTLLEITKLFESNDGDTFPDERGTAINLFNAVTAYTDHFRTSRRHDKNQTLEAARCESALFGGSGDSLKQNALNTILDVTKDARIKVKPIYNIPNGDKTKRYATFSMDCPACGSPTRTQIKDGLTWKFFCVDCQKTI